MSDGEIRKIEEANVGFVPLDYIFERHFIEPLREQDPVFYEKTRGMGIEDFINHVMGFREQMDPYGIRRIESRLFRT